MTTFSEFAMMSKDTVVVIIKKSIDFETAVSTDVIGYETLDP